MKIGLDSYTVRELNMSPAETLQWAKDRGFEGVQFESVRTMCPAELDRETLKSIKETADAMGMCTNVSVDCCNPRLFDGGAQKLVLSISEEIRAAAYAGWRELRSEMGLLKNRRADLSAWPAQLEESAEVLRALIPVLEETGCRINLELHTDSTSFEVLSVINAVGDRYVGINLDTGNPILHAEFIPEVVKRVAPYVHLAHIKDVMVFEHERGYLRQGCAVGRGMNDWDEILTTLHEANPEICVSIEDHKNLFVVPVFEEEWYKDHPNAKAYEVARILQKARGFTRRVKSGELEHWDDYEKVPYLEQMDDRLGFSLDFLKNKRKALGFES